MWPGRSSRRYSKPIRQIGGKSYEHSRRQTRSRSFLRLLGLQRGRETKERGERHSSSGGGDDENYRSILMLPVCERIQRRVRRRRRDSESRWNRCRRPCCRFDCPRIETRPCRDQHLWKILIEKGCAQYTLAARFFRSGLVGLRFTSPDQNLQMKKDRWVFDKKKDETKKKPTLPINSISMEAEKEVESTLVTRSLRGSIDFQLFLFFYHSPSSVTLPSLYTVTVERTLPYRIRGCAICYYHCYYPL